MARPRQFAADCTGASAPRTPPQSVQEWLAQQSHRDLLRCIVCGSAGDGKSTLINRLLHDAQQRFDDPLAAQQPDARRHGGPGDDIDPARPADGLSAARAQRIASDVAYHYFTTQRRHFIVADAPGRETATRHMVAGASTADTAILLVDAQQGLRLQSCRHILLVSLLGIRHVVLAINKMDLVGHDRNAFERVRDSFMTLAASLGFASITAIPLSARKGDNIGARSAKTPWYAGPTLMACLEAVDVGRQTDGPFILPVQWVSHPNAHFRGLSGTVASGSARPGDELRVTASGQTARLAKIVTFDGLQENAQAGDAVTVTFDREIDAARGDVLTLSSQPLEMSDQFEAALVWMHEDAGLVGRSYDLKLASQWTGASITTIKHRVNVSTLAHESCRQLALNDISVCNIATSKPVALARYARSTTMGGFILTDRVTHATVAAGMIRHSLRRAQNVHRQALSITRSDRERLNGHQGQVIWFTGLSGSGKSTIANALEKELHAQGKRTYILDGDNVRQGLNKDLGFTNADRVENIRRIAEVAKLMMDAGMIVMTAFISPFRRERQMARELIGAKNFVEVYIDTPLALCEQRDPKGLYKKARRGQLPNMTGIDSPYEPPQQPEWTIDGSGTALPECVRQLLHRITATDCDSVPDDCRGDAVAKTAHRP